MLRACGYLFIYGTPTALLYWLHYPLILDVVLWFVLVFVCSVLFSLIVTGDHLPKLELARAFQEKGEPIALGLSKGKSSR